MSCAAHAFTEQPIRHKLHVDGLDLVVYEWPGAGDPILLIHATGFHARCWQAVVEALPERHVFALDMPSHGESARKPPPYEWTHFGADVLGVVESLGLERVLGVGHSMGGHALVLAAAARPALFRGLILVDPVIVEPEYASNMRRLRAAEHPVSRRRNRWESPEQMFEVFSRKEPYARWERRVLMDYCRYGLLPAAGGEGFELACPPDLEAEVYASMKMDDVVSALPRVQMPVEIIRARSRRPDESLSDFSSSPTWAGLAAALPDAVDEQLPDCSHFIPMERPRWMAERIARAWARLGGARAG
jgi:pimeloyl-ACP methyl ester carboxylesterase